VQSFALPRKLGVFPLNFALEKHRHGCLPGRIAIACKHPEAEAVYVMGWLGFLAVVPWIQAFIWAFKPTNIIDIRNLPKEEKRSTDAMIARLKGETTAPDAEWSPNNRRYDCRNSHSRHLLCNLLACLPQVQAAEAHPRLWLRLWPCCVLHRLLIFVIGLRFVTPNSTNATVVQRTIQLIPRSHPTLARTHPRDRRAGRRQYAREKGPTAVPI
jgi:hypothetical protein